jgi:hypothetical protein
MSELYSEARISAYPLPPALEPVWQIIKKLVHADREVQRTNAKLAKPRRRSCQLCPAAPDQMTAGMLLIQATKLAHQLISTSAKVRLDADQPATAISIRRV